MKFPAMREILFWTVAAIGCLMATCCMGAGLQGDRYFRSVSDFGAKGNGTADDSTAIRKCVADVHDNGGGTVFFPAGTYKVSIKKSNLVALDVYGNITLKGVDRDSSIIKLADKQSDYDAIVGSAEYHTDLSNLRIIDLGFDGNMENNIVSSEDQFLKTRLLRYVIRIYSGHGVRIERCKFRNLLVNCVITLNGESVNDCEVSDCVFSEIGGGSVDCDHSTIYTSGRKMAIRNCEFYSRNGAGTLGARTAIELHGDNQTVSNCFIKGYGQALNITGVHQQSSVGLWIFNNRIEDNFIGMTIWSLLYGSGTNPALKNCYIMNNSISLNVDDWKKARVTGHYGPYGIGFWGANTADISNMYIADNTINFSNYSERQKDFADVCSGILFSFWEHNPKIATSHLDVARNTISNSPGPGMYLDATIADAIIQDNTIRNAGSTPISIPDTNRAGILIKGDTKNMRVIRNAFVAGQGPNSMKYGLVIGSNATGLCSYGETTVEGGSDIPAFLRIGGTGDWLPVQR